MKPQTLLTTHIRHGGQRIDSTRVGCSRVTGDDQRSKSSSHIRLDRAHQGVHAKAVSVIRRQHSKLIRTKTEQSGGASHGGMGLVRHVCDNAVRTRSHQRLSRARERSDVRRRPSTDQNPGRIRGVPDPALEPVQYHQLELARARSRHPRANVDVKRCGDEITQGTGEGARGGNEREIARMGESAHRREDVALQLAKQLIPLSRFLGRGHHQPTPQVFANAPSHRRDRRISELIDEQVDGPVADLPHRFLR